MVCTDFLHSNGNICECWKWRVQVIKGFDIYDIL